MDKPSYKSYKTSTNVFCQLLKSKHEHYERERFETAEYAYEMDNKTLWKFIQSNRTPSSNLHSIKQNGISYALPDELLQLWSSHYTALLNDQESNNCDLDNDFGAHIQEELNYLKTHTCMSKSEDNMGVSRDQITVNEVANVCRNMPNHKAPGADCISYEGLKYGGYTLYSSLTKLYSQSSHMFMSPLT